MQCLNDRRRIVRRYLQQRERRTIGRTAPLLPIAQSGDADADHHRELRL